MAPSRQVLLLAAVACLTSLASGTQWTVGDGNGWRARFNETGWTDGKTFMVGDTLLFKYRKGIHNVVQVGEDGFATCSLDDNQLELGAWISGNDTVELDKPGTMWFICTKQHHCHNGMKLAIDVVDLTIGPSPSPMPMPFPFPASPPPLRFPRPPAPAPAPAPSPLFRRPLFPWPFSPAPAPPAPAPAPPASPAVDELPFDAGVRNQGGSTVAAAAAAVVAAALAF